MIVADVRLPQSLAFANEAARAGHRIARTAGDITQLWYDELDALWRRERIAVAGLTEYAAFFCLERLALDRGLRVVFKGEHRRTEAGAILHSLAGPAAIVTRSALARFSAKAWPAQVARLALAARDAGPVAVRFDKAAPASAGQPRLLVSWVLAAKPRRTS